MAQTIAMRLRLETLFDLDVNDRITGTREPDPSPGPAFIVIRGAAASAWAARADVPNEVAESLNVLAATEPATWDRPPVHAERYGRLLGGVDRSGPAFAFPERLAIPPAEVSLVTDEAALAVHFSGWVPGEIAAGRSPVVAVCEGGHPVSVCFCARRSDVAAEAGVETAPAFRGRGYAARATAAWAAAVRAMGLTPIYSTDWENGASLAVARRLALIKFAVDWSIGPPPG